MKIMTCGRFTRFEAETLDDIASILSFRGRFGYYHSFANDDRSVQGIEVFTGHLLDLLVYQGEPVYQHEPGKWTRATVTEPFITCARNNGTYVHVALLENETPEQAYERFHAADKS